MCNIKKMEIKQKKEEIKQFIEVLKMLSEKRILKSINN